MTSPTPTVPDSPLETTSLEDRLAAIRKANQVALDLLPLQDPSLISRLKSGELELDPVLTDALLILAHNAIYLVEIEKQARASREAFAAEIEGASRAQAQMLDRYIAVDKSLAAKLTSYQFLVEQGSEEAMKKMVNSAGRLRAKIEDFMQEAFARWEKLDAAQIEAIKERQRLGKAMLDDEERKLAEIREEVRKIADSVNVAAFKAEIEALTAKMVEEVRAVNRPPSRFGSVMWAGFLVTLGAAATAAAIKLGFLALG